MNGEICAHINYGSCSAFATEHARFPTAAEAVAHFRDSIAALDITWDEANDMPVMDLYTSNGCACDSAMNFHDHPEKRYTLTQGDEIVTETV